MFSILDQGATLCDGVPRREVLRVGGLGAVGVWLPMLLGRGNAAGSGAADAMFGRARNVIFLWLQGGPPQHETFDPKPDAPEQIRGEFAPIATNVPGIHFCELLPRTAAMADKLAVVRSMATDSELHCASGYHVLTGYPYRGSNSRQISPGDWPYLGSIVKMKRPSEVMPAYTTVWLPDVMRLNDNVQPAGQTAGFLGRRWEPERLVCDPAAPDFEIESLRMPVEVPPLRLSGRRRLLDQVEEHFAAFERDGRIAEYGRQVQEAIGVLSSGRARQAFDLSQEPARVRERYGNWKWGQCVLLARRLIEAGVRLVHVNWVREAGDSGVDNPMWDTHAQNADRLQDVLCPQFDIGFTALLDDLESRGLLAETLVVAIGEFGRTPKINAKGGRDHWGRVFSFALAGAGIRGGQVYGSSDKTGGLPATDRVEPHDFTATLFHLLGIEPFFHDPLGRPIHATKGEPLRALLGTEPATTARRPSEGNIALVPTYSTAPLLDVAFAQDVPLAAVGTGRRVKGWQASPLAASPAPGANPGHAGPVVSREAPAAGRAPIAIGLVDQKGPIEVAQGEQAILVQEIRNPRPGRFVFSVQAAGSGDPSFYHDVFLKQFECRLVIFRFADPKKDARRREELATVRINPVFGTDQPSGRYELTKELSSPGGVNFSVGAGMGVGVIVTKTSPGTLRLAADPTHRAFIRIDAVALDFAGRQRFEEVNV